MENASDMVKTKDTTNSERQIKTKSALPSNAQGAISASNKPHIIERKAVTSDRTHCNNTASVIHSSSPPFSMGHSSSPESTEDISPH